VIRGPRASEPILVAAEVSLAAADLVPYLMAARRRLADLRVGLAIDSRNSVAAWMDREEVRAPGRMVSAMAPGRWEE
jgi:hypothetical protein